MGLNPWMKSYMVDSEPMTTSRPGRHLILVSIALILALTQGCYSCPQRSLADAGWVPEANVTVRDGLTFDLIEAPTFTLQGSSRFTVSGQCVEHDGPLCRTWHVESYGAVEVGAMGYQSESLGSFRVAVCGSTGYDEHGCAYGCASRLIEERAAFLTRIRPDMAGTPPDATVD